MNVSEAESGRSYLQGKGTKADERKRYSCRVGDGRKEVGRRELFGVELTALSSETE